MKVRSALFWVNLEISRKKTLNCRNCLNYINNKKTLTIRNLHDKISFVADEQHKYNKTILKIVEDAEAEHFTIRRSEKRFIRIDYNN